jgi:hypothetical protein
MERVNLAGVGKDARCRIVDQRIVFPAVPQPRDHVQELPGALISLAVGRMFRKPEILRGLGRAGGDDVPAGAASADVIE